MSVRRVLIADSGTMIIRKTLVRMCRTVHVVAVLFHFRPVRELELPHIAFRNPGGIFLLFFLVGKEVSTLQPPFLNTL